MFLNIRLWIFLNVMARAYATPLPEPKPDKPKEKD